MQEREQEQATAPATVAAFATATGTASSSRSSCRRHHLSSSPLKHQLARAHAQCGPHQLQGTRTGMAPAFFLQYGNHTHTLESADDGWESDSCRGDGGYEC